MTSRISRGQAGQAGVEWIGTVVAVALLCAALALWLGRTVALPERPPDPVAHLVAPLLGVPGGSAPAAGPAGTAQAPAAVRAPLMGRPAETLAEIVARIGPQRRPGSRGLAWLEGRTRAALALGRTAGASFGIAFAERMRQRLAQLADRPLDIDLTPDPAELTGIAVAQDLVRHLTRDPAAFADYLRRLRTMSPREAAAVLGADAGTLAADGVVEVAEVLVKRLLLRGVVRTARGGRGPAPG